MNRHAPGRHCIVLALSAPLLALSLVACGSDDTAATAEQAPQTQPGGQSDGRPEGSGGPGGPGGPGGARAPGGVGEVVAVDGTTAQVRNERTGQVAVSWTDATTFTTTAARSLADVKVGDCVVVVGADEDGTPAESVSVTAAVDGSCADAARGGAGRGPGLRGGPGGPAGSDFTPPEGAPDDLPEGRRPGGRGGMVLGEVTAVDATTLTVEARSFAGGTPSEEGAEPTTESRTVTVDAETTVTAVVDAEADAVEVGICVNASGEIDEVGAVTAESIAVSQPVDGACGLGGFGGADRPENGKEV